MHPTTTIPTIYPPLPQLPPRADGETAEQYGLRALLFVTAERLTVTVDLEGLQLAAHTFRLAVCNPALTTTGAERLADVGRMIADAVRRRLALAQEAEPTAQPPAGGPSVDRPNLGPMAPLTPPPTPQTPPSAARRATPARKAPAAPVYVPPVRLAPVGAPLADSEAF